MVEALRPWTALFALNEEYFLASQEIERRKQLPIIRLVSRKVQQEGKPRELPGTKPWEKYTSKEVISLYYDYDADDPAHEGFTLQDQAKRDRERGLKAVFVDVLSLRIPLSMGDEGPVSYEVRFDLHKVPSDSNTAKEIRAQVREANEKYNVYPGVSKRDKIYYRRIFQYPSCLEVTSVQKATPKINPHFRPVDVSDRILGGLTSESQDFLLSLWGATSDIVKLAHKRFDTKSGYILDGLISAEEIRRRMGL